MAKFFNPKDCFGVTGLGEIQTVELAYSSTELSGRGSTCGDAAANKVVMRTERFAVEERRGGFFSLPAIGCVMNGWHIDGVTVTFSLDNWPTVEVVGHADVDAPFPETEGCHTFSPSFDMPTGYGVIPFDCGRGVRSMTYYLSCSYAVLADEEGNLVAVDNYDGIEAVEISSTGEDPVPPSDEWTESEDNLTQDLQNAEIVTRRFFKSVEADAE